jgi:hypothetical protein
MGLPSPLIRISWSYNAARGTLLRDSFAVIDISQSLHSPPGAGPMLGRQDAGAGAGSEPASEPEPLPAAGRAAPEHCCRGGRSSGYWVPALTFQFFFYGRYQNKLRKLLAAPFIVA